MDTSLFAISMQKHIIFVLGAGLFFILQFLRTKRWYQLVMAAAFAVSLLIYADSENEKLFYGVGIAEAVLLLFALVLNIIQSVRISRAEKAKKAEEEAGHQDGSDAGHDAGNDAEPSDPPAAPTATTDV